jgi:hypothetical protein
MIIYLHNPSHNGDQFLTLGIVRKIIEQNLDKNFVIVPACSMYLFSELLNDNVNLQMHPVIWDGNKNIHLDNNIISTSHSILWNTEGSNIYINMWLLLCKENHNCIGLINRENYIKKILMDIKNTTGVDIYFNCDKYKELIPTLPNINIENLSKISNFFDCNNQNKLMPVLSNINIENIKNKLLSYKKKIIFFYNQNSFCGIENGYPKNINENVLTELIQKYGDEYIILLTKQCNIIHPNVLFIENEFNIFQRLDGLNLVINAYIADLCDKIYFKNNGGSLFILNQMNIPNSINKQYVFIGSRCDYNVINEYGIKCELREI